MSSRILALLSIIAIGVPAIGCAAGNTRRKYEQLVVDHDALRGEKTRIQRELSECRTRCAVLQQDRRAIPFPVAAPVPPEMPEGLQGKVDIRRRGNDTVIDIPSDFFFASGSSRISHGGESTMGQVMDYIRSNHPRGVLRIEGHSDSDPIRRSRARYHCNRELAFARAHAVEHLLVEKGGFDASRIVCESYGEHRPQDPANKSRNRRVEIVIAD